MAARVEQGMIIPDSDHVKQVIHHLQQEVKSNKAVEAEWKANPRQVLAERGIPYDMQTELLKETGRTEAIAAAKCRISCLCTKCCVTVVVVL